MTDETSELERQVARAMGVAAFFQLGTLAWIRRRGLDLDDYIAYLAAFTWSSLEPGIGARRLADIMAAQVAASGTFTATAAGDDAESWIDLVGPDAELLRWAGPRPTTCIGKSSLSMRRRSSVSGTGSSLCEHRWAQGSGSARKPRRASRWARTLIQAASGLARGQGQPDRPYYHGPWSGRLS